MQTINNKTKVIYKYSACIASEGSHSIGPAIVEDDDTTSRSNIVIIKSGRQEIAQQPLEDENPRKKMFLKLEANNKNIVVGQKIEGTISFYCSVANVSLHGFNPPKIDGFICNDRAKPLQGVQEIEGQQYSYVTWHWQLFANQAGQLLIPACSVNCTVKNEDDFLSNFSSFFYVRQNKKRIHSDSLVVDVNSLPSYLGTVDAVGEFQNFTAHLNQAVARQGDGIVVSLSLEGDADFENLNLELQNVPHTFKLYSSKQIIDIVKNTSLSRKTFEFILQGMEAGEWELPEQKFTYYHVDSESYKTLKTSSLLIKILPQIVSKKYIPPTNDNDNLTSVETDGDIDTISFNMYGPWRKIPERTMPWWLFMVLLFVPFGFWLSGFIRQMFYKIKKWNQPKIQWEKAFKSARYKLYRARQNNDFAALYTVFVELFAIRCSVKISVVSEQMTKKVLLAGGFSQEQLRDWEVFFTTLSAFVFYSAEFGESQKKLFDQADKWIDILEKIL